MSKKKWIIIAASILVVVAIGLGIGLGIGLNSKSSDGSIWYKANVDDYMGSQKREIFELVDSTEELNAIFGDYYNKTYNREFFKKKSLIVLVLGAPDSGRKYSINRVFVEDDVLTVDAKIERYSSWLTAEWTWEILIEVKKSDIKDTTELQKVFTEVYLYEVED